MKQETEVVNKEKEVAEDTHLIIDHAGREIKVPIATPDILEATSFSSLVL